MTLQPVDANAQREPTTPGTKMRQLKADLETKETENEALKNNISDLVKALEKIELVKSDITNDNNDSDKDAKKKKKNKCPVVPAKTAYKFYCEAFPAKKKQNGADLQKLWKEEKSEIRDKYFTLAHADKARYQSEMDEWNKEQKALELYYDKKKQEQAMAFYEAHLEAQALLEKVQEDGTAKKTKKAAKDPDAPKRAMSSYMYFVQDKRASVVEANPTAKVTEISKILGEMWKELDKTKDGQGGAKQYEEMAAEDRERYNKEKEVYDAKVAGQKEADAMAKEARLEQDKKEAMELLESQTVITTTQHVGGSDDVSVISDITKSTAAKKKKDPNAPKRALTAYNYFVSENREAIKAKMPATAANAEVFAELGKQWKELSDRKKQKYNKMSAKDQERYVKEMEAYNKTNNN